jgi:Rhodopirellula transposase DDE domain
LILPALVVYGIPGGEASLYIVMMIDESPLRIRFDSVRSSLDERGRRLSAAAEAKAAGYGGIAAAARATKVARSTIGRGLKDLRDPDSLTGNVRRKGGGSPRLMTRDPMLLEDLRQLLEPATMGDPMRPLRWVSKSHDKLATALRAKGHKVSSSSLPKLLGELKYCRHFNRKTKESGKHPDRDAQFEYINAKVETFQAADQPVISIDAKKKELVGEFKNGGSDYGPQGQPIEVNAHDFENKELGKVTPYGIYDIGANLGYVSLGVDHDTGEFAVNGVRLWLDRMGRKRYPAMTRLMITADGGGSNGSRLRLWKMALQKLADETGLTIQVCHYPPGTSKWNKIEHRMFCHITQNWRATPLISLLVAIELIANTTTKTGLTIRCELDRNLYPKGIKVSDEELATLNIKRDKFHPEWNYAIAPRNQNMER